MGDFLDTVGGSVANAYDPGGLLRSNPSSGEEDQERSAEDARKARENSLIAAHGTQQQLVKEAVNYRKSLPALQSSYGGLAADQRRNTLDQRNLQATTGANNRGLLYSGLKQAADQQNLTDYARGNAHDQASINQQTNAQADAMDSQAVNSGMQLQNLQQQSDEAAFKNAMAIRQQRLGEAQGFGGGIGGPVGAGIGGLFG